MRRITILLLSLFITVPVFSQSMYIDDKLFVPLRSGAGTSFRIVHKGVKSGTKLEVIEHDSNTGYSHVRTPSGLDGYLPTRYLVNEPIARDQLIRANAELTELRQQNTKLKADLSTLNAEHRKLGKAHKSTLSELDGSNKELTNIKSISSNALNLDRRNRELRESNEQLRNELELLQTENMRLKDKSESNMMMIGGGLVTLGVIIALLVPMLKPSKKSDSWA